MPPVMRVREILRMLFDDGWYIHSPRGSHRQLKHPTKRGCVTVNGGLADVLDAFLVASILRQAQMDA